MRLLEDRGVTTPGAGSTSGELAARTPLAQDLLERAERWRGEADVLRRHHAVAQAEVLEGVVAELERVVRQREREAELLTLADAARETGRSRSGLVKAIGRGALPNAGRKGAPRVQRAALLHYCAITPAEGEGAL